MHLEINHDCLPEHMDSSHLQLKLRSEPPEAALIAYEELFPDLFNIVYEWKKEKEVECRGDLTGWTVDVDDFHIFIEFKSQTLSYSPPIFLPKPLDHRLCLGWNHRCHATYCDPQFFIAKRLLDVISSSEATMEAFVVQDENYRELTDAVDIESLQAQGIMMSSPATEINY